MKHTCKLSYVVFIFLIAFVAQPLIAQKKDFVHLEYIKLPTGDWNGYSNHIQKDWKPLYRSMIETGNLKAWKLFWVRFPAGQEIPYDIVNVTFHKDSIGMSNSSVSDFYNQNRGEGDDFFLQMEKTLLNTANRVKVEIYEIIEEAHGAFELDSLAKSNQNYQIDFMDAAQAQAVDYVQMEKEIFRPMHQVAMEDGRLKSWTLAKRTNQNNNAILQRFIIFNQWSSWANWQAAGRLQDFQKVDPELDQGGFNEIFNKIGKLRQMTKSEMWSIWDEL